ncbi:MAG: M23 family metallopeptidase [bacterium]|nr:M23 family metallopeptidase [bacterium]
MRKFLLILVFVFPVLGFGAAPSVSVFPDTVIQGEPLRIAVENVSGAAAVRKILFDGKSVGVFLYQGKPAAFIGIDLNKKAGDYKLVVTLADGTKLEKIITVGKRPKVEAPLGIPEKLGGNTPAAAKKVVSTLAQENLSIYSARTIPKQLWSGSFNFPISNPVITDDYGYSRQTVGYVITHKGTDFRAKEGTPVVAMNRGIVRLGRKYQVYGETVIIDHGFGLHTVYMHFSKIKVNEGELVKQGQVIGLSGQTGYAGGPHLHVSVWIDKVSINPMKFMELFR